MKRTIFATTAASLARFRQPAVPAAADKPAAPTAKPPYETRKVEGTDNVYIFRYGNAQSMFVVTSAGVIATDPIAYANRGGFAGLPRRDQEGDSQPISIWSTAIITSITSPAASRSRTPARRSSRTSARRSASRSCRIRTRRSPTRRSRRRPR